ncbi:hypothetical protein ERO13_D10G028200v2 [Gossypium hirsutum]|uniref:Protein E6-like n=1 Tax=Gossypium hirsutum TaxID=3635 RepID=A0A1U8MT85_GOSHI|nr:protein E6-like [Gossypium hirsutum]KAG4124254.1 hypothetical protein ERO13_D10G028200v2 [Gossypium hirsutum]
MASSPKFISYFFLLALFSVEIHGRDFFSKIPSVNTNEKEVTNKEEQTTLGKKEQEPRFVPETQNGYGLYGHESGQLPPSTASTKETYEPYVTPVKYHPDEPYNSIPASKTNNKDSYFYSKTNAYGNTEQQSEARFNEKGWTTKETNNYNGNYYNGNNEALFTEKGWSTKENQNSNNYYNGNNEAMFTEKGWSTKENQNNNNYYNGNNEYNNVEKQGMSDTRYLENGKYYYRVGSENNYYPNRFENSRGVGSRNEFNENRYNNMGKYNQNQEEFEEEFEP